jgi:non-ribosomal peptide synthase protein (TIGR01720 family)
VAYVVPAVPGAVLGGAGLRARVAGRLPEFMVPAAVVVLESLPVTASGKLDRAALPPPEFAAGPGRGPAGAAEELWCALFAAVLGVERVGAEDSFFDLGGDSIVSMLLVARARRAGVAVTPREVFQFKSPAGLAAAAGGAVVPEVAAQDGPGVVPATPVMCWLAGLAGAGDLAGAGGVAGGGREFSQSMLVVVPPGLGAEALVVAVAAVAGRHEVLRARLEAAGGRWRLVVPAGGAVRAGGWVRRVDAAGLDGAGLAAAAGAEAAGARSRLDPVAGVMVQVVWLDAGAGVPGRLLVVIHHLVVDGVSWRVLVPDLAGAWQAAAAGREPVVDGAGTSFRRHALLLAGRAGDPVVTAELPGWRAILGGADAPLASRPLDPARDTAAVVRRVPVPVPEGLTGALLTGVPAVFHAGISDVLLAGLAVAVAGWRQRRGGGPVLVDVESHGREPAGGTADLSRTVGWFTAIFPVRLDPGPVSLAEVAAGGAAAGRAVMAVKEQLRAVPGGGLGYGLLRYLNAETGPVLAALPVPQIGFNYLGRFMAGRPAGGPGAGSRGAGRGDWQAVPLPAVPGGQAARPAAHILEAAGIVHELPGGPQLVLSLSAPAGLVPGHALQDLAGRWAAALAGIAACAARPGSGGHTPSDFPLVTLTQDQIEELEELAAGTEEGTSS